MNCPNCNSTNYYFGISGHDCINPNCIHFNNGTANGKSIAVETTKEFPWENVYRDSDGIIWVEVNNDDRVNFDCRPGIVAKLISSNFDFNFMKNEEREIITSTGKWKVKWWSWPNFGDPNKNGWSIERIS